MKYTIYTDGACSGNPGPGGWAWVSVIDEDTFQAYGGEKVTTNNRMELTGAIKGLEFIMEKISQNPIEANEVELHTDSQYVKNGITSWINSWKKNGWKTASKSPVKNKEYWMELDELSTKLNVKYIWVKGHAGHFYNERCDELARRGVEENR